MLMTEAATGPTFFYLVPWIVFFPIIGLLTNIIIGGKLSEKVIGAIACTASGLAFIVAVLQAISLAANPGGGVVNLANWISIGELNIQWAFQVDALSVTMMLVVSGVGTLIHIYAVGYMHEDVRFNGDPGRFRRFFVFLNLFIAAMMVLVSSDNYMMMFVGWEGVGLCSYLLIGFWYEKGKDGIGNAIAAKKAFVTNRVGDFGFIIAAFIMFWSFHTFNFDVVFQRAPAIATITPWVIPAITLFMLLGVTGKSAQIPLYVWLPDAMAGPTPVSALIHAATMVTAGVYLIARSHVLYALAPQVQLIVALVGGITGLFAATIALAQFDIKKVLAYSTISQLGFMVAAVGMGAIVAGMFHLVMHAFFKALLFLSAGSVIQGVEHGHHHVEHDPKLKKSLKGQAETFDPQDMRNMGGLRTKMKVTFWVYVIGALALAGIPPLAGFWSKDEILAEGFALRPSVYILLTVAAFCTAFYMGRQIFLVFFGKPRSAAVEHARENPPIMTVPLIILASLSVIGGFLNLPKIQTFANWLDLVLKTGQPVESAQEAGAAGGFNFLTASVSVLLALAAIGLAWWLYIRRYPEMQKLPAAKRPDDPLRTLIGPVFKVLENKYWVDELYWTVILNPYISLSRFLADVVEWRFWHDWFHDVVIAGGYRWLTRLLSVRVDTGGIDAAANGLGTGVQRSAGWLRRIQTGFVRNYALAVLLGVVVIIGYLILR
jgi:NADH-quinone oxidoreductase subunit L